jgi:hypothetical protein
VGSIVSGGCKRRKPETWGKLKGILQVKSEHKIRIDSIFSKLISGEAKQLLTGWFLNQKPINLIFLTLLDILFLFWQCETEPGRWRVSDIDLRILSISY